MSPVDHSDTRLSKANRAFSWLYISARRLLAWSRYLFMPVAAGFIALAFWSSRDLLSGVIREATVTGLITAVTLWSFFHVGVPLFDLLVLRGMGVETRYEILWRIYLARLPTKYLPGGIWHNLTRLADLNQAGLSRPRVTALAILQVSVPASLAFIMGGSLVFLEQRNATWGWVGLASASAGALVLLGTPFLISRVVLRGRDPLTISGYAGAALSTATAWVLGAGAFYAYVSTYPILAPESSFLNVAGAYLMAWGTGFISIFTPQGFGVFEATAADLIPSNTEFSTMVAIVAGFRVVILASDTLAWVASKSVIRLSLSRENRAQ